MELEESQMIPDILKLKWLRLLQFLIKYNSFAIFHAHHYINLTGLFMVTRYKHFQTVISVNEQDKVLEKCFFLMKV